MLAETGNSLGAILDFDLTVDDQLATAKVNIIASSSVNYQTNNSRSVDAEVELKACFLEALESGLVGSGYPLRQVNT